MKEFQKVHVGQQVIPIGWTPCMQINKSHYSIQDSSIVGLDRVDLCSDSVAKSVNVGSKVFLLISKWIAVGISNFMHEIQRKRNP